MPIMLMLIAGGSLTRLVTTASWHIDAVGGRPPHLRHRPARAGPRRPQPHYPMPPGRDAGGAAATTAQRRRTHAPAGGQHRPEALMWTAEERSRMIGSSFGLGEGASRSWQDRG